MQLPFFYNPNPISDSGNLSEETSRHIVQVLRMASGEKLQLTDGKGNLQTAEILSAHKKNTAVKIITSSFIHQRKKKISIGISPIKNISRFEWFLEKATEIGISEIITLNCERSERQQFRMDRMQNILIAAMLQSRQVWLPEIAEPKPFAEIISTNNYPHKFIAHCYQSEKMPLNALLNNEQSDRLVLIGPEGDFTPEEVDMAVRNYYAEVSLGENRLRTETAGIAACLMLNFL